MPKSGGGREGIGGTVVVHTAFTPTLPCALVPYALPPMSVDHTYKLFCNIYTLSASKCQPVFTLPSFNPDLPFQGKI